MREFGVSPSVSCSALLCSEEFHHSSRALNLFGLREMWWVSEICVTWLWNPPRRAGKEALTTSKAVWLTYLFAYRAKMKKQEAEWICTSPVLKWDCEKARDVGFNSHSLGLPLLLFLMENNCAQSCFVLNGECAILSNAGYGFDLVCMIFSPPHPVLWFFVHIQYRYIFA